MISRFLESSIASNLFVLPKIDLVRLKNQLNSEKLVWIFNEHPLPKVSSWTVLDVLKKNEKLANISDDEWKERVQWGGLYINGYPVNDIKYNLYDRQVPFKLEYFIPLCKWSERFNLYPKFDPKYLVNTNDDTDDDGLIIAFKPHGLPTKTPKDQHFISLHNYIQDHLQKKVHFPSRLDVGTCGIVPGSINKRMNRHLSYLFQGSKSGKNIDADISRRINKEYIFATHKPWPFDNKNEEIIINRCLGPSNIHPIIQAVQPTNNNNDIPADGFKKAITIFSLLSQIYDENKQQYKTYILAKPITGRTHQIRVHAASIGLPVINDPFYGGLNAKANDENNQYLNLMAYRLSLYNRKFDKYQIYYVPNDLLPEWINVDIINSLPSIKVPKPKFSEQQLKQREQNNRKRKMEQYIVKEEQ